MVQKLDRWTIIGGVALMIGALFACKKKEEEAPPPVETPPAPVASKEEPKKEEPKKDDEVKRYGDKETAESGTVRVLAAMLKVYKEADAGTDHIATLSRGTLVNRKARYGNWLLIDYPSGVGQLSPGWVQATTSYYKVEKVDPDQVKNQDAGVVVVNKPDASAPVNIPDAGVAAVDAAATTVADAGKKFRFKLPPGVLPTSTGTTGGATGGSTPPPPKGQPPKPGG